MKRLISILVVFAVAGAVSCAEYGGPSFNPDTDSGTSDTGDGTGSDTSGDGDGDGDTTGVPDAGVPDAGTCEPKECEECETCEECEICETCEVCEVCEECPPPPPPQDPCWCFRVADAGRDRQICLTDLVREQGVCPSTPDKHMDITFHCKIDGYWKSEKTWVYPCDETPWYERN